MTRETPTDPLLDSLFADARAARPQPDAALMARILGDAADLVPVSAPAPAPRPTPWSRMTAALDRLLPGGMAGAASLSTCALGGLLIGYAGLGDLPLMAGASLFGEPQAVVFDAGALGDEAAYLGLEDGA